MASDSASATATMNADTASVNLGTGASGSLVQLKAVKGVTLSSVNYFAWRAQVAAHLRIYGLMPYVEGTATPNSPVFERQDQLVLAWLLSSSSAEVMLQITSLGKSSEVWEALQCLYSSSSRTREMFLRLDLRMVQKGSMSMIEFLTKVNRMLEMLAACGEKMETRDVILNVLNALGPEYEPFVTSVTTCMDWLMSFVDLQAMLLDQELQLEVVTPKMGSVNTATVEKGKSDEARSSEGKCQIRTKRGHLAINCYNKLNIKNYLPIHSRKPTSTRAHVDKSEFLISDLLLVPVAHINLLSVH